MLFIYIADVTVVNVNQFGVVNFLALFVMILIYVKVVLIKIYKESIFTKYSI